MAALDRGACPKESGSQTTNLGPSTSARPRTWAVELRCSCRAPIRSRRQIVMSTPLRFPWSDEYGPSDRSCAPSCPCLWNFPAHLGRSDLYSFVKSDQRPLLNTPESGIVWYRFCSRHRGFTSPPCSPIFRDFVSHTYDHRGRPVSHSRASPRTNFR